MNLKEMLKAWRLRKRTKIYAPALCAECGANYEDLGLDITLPNWQWEMIHPSIDGILCGNCIAKRATELPGAIAIRAYIEFANTENEDMPIKSRASADDH